MYYKFKEEFAGIQVKYIYNDLIMTYIYISFILFIVFQVVTEYVQMNLNVYYNV